MKKEYEKHYNNYDCVKPECNLKRLKDLDKLIKEHKKKFHGSDGTL